MATIRPRGRARAPRSQRPSGSLKDRARERFERALRRLLRAAGYQLVRADYYSPIPELAELPASTWERPAPMPGLELELDAQLDLVERELAPHVAEFAPPADPPGNEEGFFLANPSFGPVDAELLYAIVRRHRPSRVLELGSGFSTLVIARAAARNAADGAAVEHRVVDPLPARLLDRAASRLDLRRISAAEVPVEEFTALEADDVLFIDTTHTVKAGGEVNFLLLEVLPRLRPGALVHVHDFFRPFEYPKQLFEQFGVYWQEHYLLQALLISNPEFEVLLANHALARLEPERLGELVPSLAPGVQPSSLWLRKLESP